MKAILVLSGVCAVLLLFWGAFMVPCTPPDRRSLCRKEMYRLREYLLDRDFSGISCISPKFAGRTNEIDFLVGEFCDKVNEIVRSHNAGHVFHVEQSLTGEGRVLIDKWGVPYNFSTTEDVKKNQWNALKRTHTISNIVVWSSGPNKINEYGANDDVCMVNRLYREDGGEVAKEADSAIEPTVALPIRQR